MAVLTGSAGPNDKSFTATSSAAVQLFEGNGNRISVKITNPKGSGHSCGLGSSESAATVNTLVEGGTATLTEKDAGSEWWAQGIGGDVSLEVHWYLES